MFSVHVGSLLDYISYVFRLRTIQPCHVGTGWSMTSSRSMTGLTDQADTWLVVPCYWRIPSVQAGVWPAAGVWPVRPIRRILVNSTVPWTFKTQYHVGHGSSAQYHVGHGSSGTQYRVGHGSQFYVWYYYAFLTESVDSQFTLHV